MKDKKKFILNGKKILSEQDFHREISSVMGFPDFYGENLDALWDVLTGYVDVDGVLVWESHIVSKHSIGETRFNLILSVFNDVQEEYPEDGFEYVLA